MSNFIEHAKWRYATKKFDTTKKISDSDLEFLKEAIQLASSSYGLQPYKVIIVENPELRAKLLPVSWGQAQITDVLVGHPVMAVVSPHPSPAVSH